MIPVLPGAAIAAIAAAFAAPASGSVQTIGGSFASGCFQSARAHTATLESIGECDRALAGEALVLSDRVATHVNRGILYLRRGEAARAEVDFDRALALDPAQPDAWLNKGIARYSIGDPSGAAVMFGKAIDYRTSAPALAYYARGLANEEQGRVREAYSDFRRAQQLQPSWPLPARELQRYQLRR